MKRKIDSERRYSKQIERLKKRVEENIDNGRIQIYQLMILADIEQIMEDSEEESPGGRGEVDTV